MAPLKFAANVSMMFKECSKTAERIARAKAYGFRYVEITAPYFEAKEDISKGLNDCDMGCSLVNAMPEHGDYKVPFTKNMYLVFPFGGGPTAKSDQPDSVENFRERILLSIEYAKAFQTKRMHVLAGIPGEKYSAQEAETAYIENVRLAADLAAKEGITVMVEAVNSIITCPGFFVDHPDKALDLIKKIDRPNVKFQLDIFHLQICMGNLTQNIKKYLPYTDYIQISQAPNRTEPGFEGEINYKYILEELVNAKYDGFVGLEYNPKGDTVEGLKWLQDFGYTL